MARTRALVERDLAKAQKLVTKFEASLGSKPDKKVLRHLPIWRRLKAAESKFKNQLHFIDKRQKKVETPS